MRDINNTLDLIEQKELQNKVLENDDENYLDLQKEFFQKKQRYYKEQVFIEERTPPLNNKSSDNSTRPNRTGIAYFCYYTSESKELKTENSFPSKKTWIEIGKRFGKDNTNIQKAYNKINSDSSERLKKSKVTNIQYVVDKMLSKYPEAKRLAEKELDIVKLN